MAWDTQGRWRGGGDAWDILDRVDQRVRRIETKNRRSCRTFLVPGFIEVDMVIPTMFVGDSGLIVGVVHKVKTGWAHVKLTVQDLDANIIFQETLDGAREVGTSIGTLDLGYFYDQDIEVEAHYPVDIEIVNAQTSPETAQHLSFGLVMSKAI